MRTDERAWAGWALAAEAHVVAHARQVAYALRAERPQGADDAAAFDGICDEVEAALADPQQLDAFARLETAAFERWLARGEALRILPLTADSPPAPESNLPIPDGWLGPVAAFVASLLDRLRDAESDGDRGEMIAEAAARSLELLKVMDVDGFAAAVEPGLVGEVRVALQLQAPRGDRA